MFIIIMNPCYIDDKYTLMCIHHHVCSSTLRYRFLYFYLVLIVFKIPHLRILFSIDITSLRYLYPNYL